MIKLEQWEQDIILACKGRYEVTGDKLEDMKKVISNINGHSVEHFGIACVKHWMWRIYEKLLTSNEHTSVTMADLQSYVTGNDMYLTMRYSMECAEKKGDDLGFTFLYHCIGNCRVTEFESLELNYALATPEDIKRCERRKRELREEESDPIDVLKLSNRASQVLKRNGIFKMKDIKFKGYDYFIKLNGIGEVVAAEISDKLTAYRVELCSKI